MEEVVTGLNLSIRRDERRLSVENIDERRQDNIAYEYLCHLEEAREWIQTCIKEAIPASRELEERLRNGVYFAKVAHFIAPELLPLKKIYDVDQSVYGERGLHFRHTDNINHWLFAMKSIGLPSYFYPTAFDVYEKKNMPKAIYCIHALSLYLYKLGRAPAMRDLLGKVKFSLEEITTTQTEFIKYGIKLPAFGKIDGIFANEINADNAAFHASVIAINIAVDRQNSETLLSALTNSNSKLQSVIQDYIESYKEKLYITKTIKLRNADQRLVDKSYIPDIYDCLLTQSEIQQQILSVNQQFLLKSIINKDANSMRMLMSHAVIGITEFIPDFADDYLDVLLDKVKVCSSECLELSQIQKTITQINHAKYQQVITVLVIFILNEALEDSELAHIILKAPILQLPAVDDSAADHYYAELLNVKKQNRTKSNYFEHAIRLLCSVPDIKDENCEIYSFAETLVLDEKTKAYPKKYMAAVIDSLCSKEDFSNYLTYSEVKTCIVKVNEKIKKDNMNRVIQEIKVSLSSNSATSLLNCISKSEASIVNVIPEYKDLYFYMLCSHGRKFKLTYHEVQDIINRANEMAANAQHRGMSTVALNMALQNHNFKAAVEAINVICKQGKFFSKNDYIYYTELQETKRRLSPMIESEDLYDDSCISWISSNIIGSAKYYFNIKTQQSFWAGPPPYDISIYLCEQDIINAISAVNDDTDNIRRQALTKLITHLQAFSRGFIVRGERLQRMKHFQNNLDSIIKIQKWWRVILQQKVHLGRKQHIRKNLPSVIKIQAYIKMVLARKKYLDRKKYLSQQESSVKIIQSHWKAYKTQQIIKSLLDSSNPSLTAIYKIVHLSEISDDDYSEEFALQEARGKVVCTIRHLQLLEKQVDERDLKIGLLVQNRITLESLASQRGNQSPCVPTQNRSLMLNKKYRQEISMYESLFYLLQTEPKYLAKLMCAQSSVMSTKLIESTIFSLYNYGSTPREEYLLLHLFRTALEEEIKQNVKEVGDIISGNSSIIKYVIAFYKNEQGCCYLRELLGPLVQKVISDETLYINTDPVEVYRIWINELEVSTGKSCDLPYDVSIEEAMTHDEIQKRLKNNLKRLVELSAFFCDTIIDSQELIPYGILYIAKVLKYSLVKKFPEAPLEEILKTVGHILYYRYINSSIVAPDAFHIVKLDPEQTITNQQRKSLGNIAKILQMAASNKYFTNEINHLTCLNPLLQECHEKFEVFFQRACETEDLEQHFDVNMYSEATLLVKPVVYLTPREIFSIKDLLVKHEDIVAQDSFDPLHEILEDLNKHDKLRSQWENEQLLRNEITLTLQNKYSSICADEPRMRQLYVEAKQMLVLLLRIMSPETTLSKMLRKLPCKEEMQRFNEINHSRTTKKEEIESKSGVLNIWDSLSNFQTELQNKLAVLELSGQVSSKNDYQDILNSIGNDIVNRWKYRQSRRREIVKLRRIQKQLDAKTTFYEEKLEYYDRYSEACLRNLSMGRKSHRSFLGKESKPKTRMPLKYSGAKLHEKGILLKLRDIPDSQFKNVIFEISAIEGDDSVFLVTATFMDVAVEQVQIDIQNLLNLQYQGVAIIDILDGVKVNVNLLIFLLNSKFYRKKT